jgi:hypothetical protein
MEAAIIKDIFARSVEAYSLRYSRFIGDGDTNTYKAVVHSKPYGDILIDQVECVGHVQKRWAPVSVIWTNMKGRKLEDGKSLDGRGRLTDKEEDGLQIRKRTAYR